MLQLKDDYQGEIAIRATAHKVRTLIFALEKEIATIGTKTVESFSGSYIQKLKQLADKLESNATKYGELSNDRLLIFLKREAIDFEDTLLAFYDRILRQGEGMVNDAKYTDLKICVARMLELDYFAIMTEYFQHKTNVVANELPTATTINYAATYVRAHEVENTKLYNIWKAMLTDNFAKAAKTANVKKERDIEALFVRYRDEQVKPALTGYAKMFFERALKPNEDAKHFIDTRVPELITKFVETTRGGHQAALVQYVKDLLADA